MCLGENIYYFRKAFGLSQQDLADRIGVARSTVSQWEGNYGYPRMGNLRALAFVFRVTPTILNSRWSPPMLELIAKRALADEVVSQPLEALPPLAEISSIELDRPPSTSKKSPRHTASIHTYLLRDRPAAHSIVLDAADSDASKAGYLDVFYDPLATLKAGDLALVENADHHLRFRRLQLEDLSNNVAVVLNKAGEGEGVDPRDVILRILGEIFWWQSSETPLKGYQW